jgi:flagellar assembly protein FliH
MNSSKNSDFSSSELETLSVWRLPDIAGNTQISGGTERPYSQPQLTPHLTVTEIEAMQKQAYDEAFDQGKVDGLKQGYTQGYEEGRKKGYEENNAALIKKAEDFNNLMEALSEPFKALDEEVENELVKLSIGLASQIIRREIKLDAGQVIAAVREAITVLPLSLQKVNLYLHPEDAELVRSVLALDETSTTWKIIEDPLITRGGCKIYTDVSHVDATVENRLAAAIATVFGSERDRDRTS